MMKLPSRRSAYGLILLMTIPLGLAVRMAPLGLSAFFYKYGGSVLWAMALYWFIAAWMPQRSSAALGAIAAAAAAVLEFSRLWHTAATDAFRGTPAGRILLGKYFSFKNIAAYWLAIGLAALLDQWIVRRATPDPPAQDRLPE
ncbi:MAG: DUF2809 domain-containing protein [Acidobacteriota bacterium]